MDWFQISVEATPPTNYHKVIVDSMAEPLSKHARLSAHDVIGMLEDVEVSSDEYDSDEDECAGEVICDGSDIEFQDFDTAEVDLDDDDVNTAEIDDEDVHTPSHLQNE